MPCHNWQTSGHVSHLTGQVILFITFRSAPAGGSGTLLYPALHSRFFSRVWYLIHFFGVLRYFFTTSFQGTFVFKASKDYITNLFISFHHYFSESPLSGKSVTSPSKGLPHEFRRNMKFVRHIAHFLTLFWPFPPAFLYRLHYFGCILSFVRSRFLRHPFGGNVRFFTLLKHLGSHSGSFAPAGSKAI